MTTASGGPHHETDSDTFLLTVTPSLLEAGNYVRTVEYPRALDASKTVVPVEAKQTEQQPLTEAFANLPRPVSVWDGEALRSAIAQAMARKWGTTDALAAPREAEPREKYLLGLAYLNGVRVEKDAARALRLLSEAAKGGVADAALQLGFMYIHGAGVRRDDAQGVAWKEEAFRLCEAGYASEPDEECLHKAYEAVLGLDGIADYARVTDRPEEARAWCRHLEELLRSAPESDLHAAWTAECLITCARAESSAPEERIQERWQQRINAATEAIEQLEAMESRDDFADRLLGEGYCTLASLYSRCERWEDALRAFGSGVPIARRLQYDHDAVENRTLLADLFIGMGENEPTPP